MQSSLHFVTLHGIQLYSDLRTKSMIKYTSYKNLRNLLRQLLSCKSVIKLIHLKDLKYLPPQTLPCEVYREQENEVNPALHISTEGEVVDTCKFISFPRIW